MAIKLIITEPFGGYDKGQEVTDAATVQSILAGDNAAHVVAVQVPETPKAAKESKAA
jgi:hypothetical protein